MIQHVWSVLCKSSVVDLDTNNLSLHEVVEELQVDVNPKPDEAQAQVMVIPTAGILTLVTLLRREPGDQPCVGAARIRVLAPQGEELFTALETKLDLTKYKRVRLRANLQSVHVKGSGTHWLAIDLKDADSEFAQVAKVPVDIELRIAPSKPAAVQSAEK